MGGHKRGGGWGKADRIEVLEQRLERDFIGFKGEHGVRLINHDDASIIKIEVLYTKNQKLT